MYEIFVTSKEFQGKRTIQQHRIVNEVKYGICYFLQILFFSDPGGLYKYIFIQASFSSIQKKHS